ncbi:MAG: TldD/PmbA family protein [Lachnospiraceae bacterium]|nr:TldD/PmbA family protein [Lachnospiraceae bacterium]
MREVSSSVFLRERKPFLQALVQALNERYRYASVLATDAKTYMYRMSKGGVVIMEDKRFSERGFVARVYDGEGYAEYSFNEIDEAMIPSILRKIDDELIPFKDAKPEMTAVLKRKLMEDTAASFVKSTTYEIHPDEMGSEAIVERLSAIREKALNSAEGLVDAITMVSYQEIHKLFLSKNRDLEQNILWTAGGVFAMAPKQGNLTRSGRSGSVLGGMEFLDKLDEKAATIAKTAVELISAEHMIPGEYECVCSPSVTGMIVHEAFGHGVEMDMFVKDRALAKEYVGKPVASELVTMRDTASDLNDAGTYFFDDEGTLATNTVIIENGILKTGISDALSADTLGTAPTGNGRRESFQRKAYTRMTNTVFDPGTSTVEEMIASVKYGMLLDEPTSGMEDPKNWGIQCMVNVAREIRDGKLTGRIFSPIVLTGYVPDLLKSITMMGNTFETSGSGFCGKGYKEYVKVSDGGPWMKATIRLG